jgi:hypothetical protein
LEGGKEANYWPGFVDALSNVVVTMVFVMVVFVIALLYFSQNKAKEMIAAAEKASAEKLAAEPKYDPDMAKKLADALKELEAKRKENDALKKTLAEASARATAAGAASGAAAGATGGQAPPQAGSITKDEIKVAEADVKRGPAPAVASIRGTNSALEITFPNGTIELDKASKAKLEAAFAALQARAQTTGIELVSVAEAGPYSEGRRLAYYRNIAIRNWLIEHNIPTAKIRTRIAEKDTGRTTGLLQMSIPGES